MGDIDSDLTIAKISSITQAHFSYVYIEVRDV